MTATDINHETRVVNLDAEQELRIGIADDSYIRLWLIQGTAEIFGAELRLAKENKMKKRQNIKCTFDTKDVYIFRRCQFAIYSCSGCRILIEGKSKYEYISNEV